MKRTSDASLSFKKLKPSDKVTFGTGVITCLNMPESGSPLPNLPFPVATLQQINNLLDAVVNENQSTGSKQSRAAIKNANLAWSAAFGSTAAYVSLVAQGNIETIVNAGFTPTKNSTQPVVKPGVAADFTASINGVRGAVVGSVKNAVPGAVTNVFYALPEGALVSFNQDTMIITVGDKSIHINAVTQKKTEIYGLPNQAAYSVGLFSLNSAGIGAPTPTQQVITQ